ncbi:MAG TPA: hypothetical protein VNY51_01705 [Candidatus Dormibacteraeota bacterium]|nr:hypothetical protein [Candidatus Dormibacteraeota bacterium]
MGPGWTLFFEILGAAASVAVILDYLGIKPSAIAWGSIMALNQKWKLVIMLALVGLSLFFSGYGFYRSLRPRIVERTVTIEKPVEKIVQAECPKAESKATTPKTLKPKKDAATIPVEPQQTTINAPNGIGISGGNVENPTVNNFGPPPVTFRWGAESVTSTNAKFQYETTVTVTPSDAYTPVSLGFLCDVEVRDVRFDMGRSGMALLNMQYGVATDNPKAGYVAFEGMSITPDRPLYVHLWSSDPLRVLQVLKVRLKPPS